ncbi:MAG TPA: M23 family metallopeptidase [Solirubrobacteraceae bacterium]|nr:M23 family metallopeptidase [Solirubrobacteraceae bacterium]
MTRLRLPGSRLGLLVLLVVSTSIACLLPGIASGSTGGTTAPATSASLERTGGTAPSHNAMRPVARTLRASPSPVVAPRLPALRLRVDHREASRVTARVVVLDRETGDPVALYDMNRIRTNRTVTRRFPRATKLRPGRYTVRLHVKDHRGRTLRRGASTTGKAGLTVRAPRPAPAPPPAPAPAPSTGSYAFPIAGVYSLGGPDGQFGADRGKHRHQGQDLTAAEGTPIVAPIAGRVRQTAYQDEGAGEYVVLDGSDGRSYFFAHCQRGSTAVQAGQPVIRAARLCAVGSTGASSGAHLHFEIWTPGWRTPGSAPIDPLPILRAWEQGRSA